MLVSLKAKIPGKGKVTIPGPAISGLAGDDGWSPLLAVVEDGARRVLQIADWTGGQGTKPAVGAYLGEDGPVAAIADAKDIRGPVYSGPFAASAITFAAGGGLASTNVQAALQELDTEKQPSAAALTGLAALDNSAGVVEQTGPGAFTKRPTGTGAPTSLLTRADGDGRFLQTGSVVTITGTWGFSNPVTVAAATAGTHALNRDTADARFLRPGTAATVTASWSFSSPVGVPAPVAGTDAVNRDAGDARYARLATANIFAGQQTISATGATAATFQAQGENTVSLNGLRYSADAAAPGASLFKARGTQSVPAAVLLDDQCGSFDFYAHTGSGFAQTGRMAVLMSQATPAPGAMGSRFQFNCNAPGTTSLGEVLRLDHTNGLQMYGTNVVVDASRHFRLRSYTVATLPSAAVAGQMIRVSNGSTNRQTAVSDGTNWRFADGAIVS